jgi:hypothetical protein
MPLIAYPPNTDLVHQSVVSADWDSARRDSLTYLVGDPWVPIPRSYW